MYKYNQTPTQKTDVNARNQNWISDTRRSYYSDSMSRFCEIVQGEQSFFKLMTQYESQIYFIEKYIKIMYAWMLSYLCNIIFKSS